MISVERVNNYFIVNGKRITGRADFQTLSKDEKRELIRKRKLMFNGQKRPPNR